MPRVPVVPALQTGIRPLAAPQQRGVDPDPLGGLAQGLASAGDTLFRVGLEETRRTNETRVLEAENGMSSQTSQLLTGFFEKRGRNAIGGADAVLRDFDRSDEKLRANLTPEQLRVLLPRLMNMRQSLESSALRHEANENTRVNVETTVSAIATAQERGLVDPANTAALGQALGSVESSVDRLAELSGWSDATRTEKKAEATSALLSGAVRKLISLEQVDAAERLFNSVQGRLTEQDAAPARNALLRGTTKVRAQEGFDTLRQEFNGDSTKMREAARTRYSGDLEDQVINYIDYQRGVDKQAEAEQRQRQDRAKQQQREAILVAIEDGRPLTPSQLLFAKANGLMDDVRRRQSQLQNGTAPETNLAVWARLQSMPQATLAQQDVNALRSVLDERDWRQAVLLINAAKEPKGGGYQRIRGTSELIHNGLQSAGLIESRVTQSQMKNQRPEVLERAKKFEDEVQSQLDWMSDATGKKPTPKDVSDVISATARQYLEVKNGFFARDSMVFAPDLLPSDGRDTRRPLSLIAPADVARFRDEISAMGMRPTQALIERYSALLTQNVSLAEIMAQLRNVK